ncbi:MAG: hypothetical protein M3362_15850, partial [Acidobacteriota bacterium]|nr:hypothetical protein [Acidobacteriota bacterium]
MSYRELRPQPQAESDFEEFLGTLHQALTDGKRDPNDVVRDTLYELYYGAGKSGEGIGRTPDPASLTPSARAALH